MRVELDEILEQYTVWSLNPNSFSPFRQKKKYISPHSLPPAELYITTSTQSQLAWLLELMNYVLSSLLWFSEKVCKTKLWTTEQF